jgi:hypothetical protein
MALAQGLAPAVSTITLVLNDGAAVVTLTQVAALSGGFMGVVLMACMLTPQL